MQEEFEALGQGAHYERRGAVSDEQMRVLRTLWTEEMPRFSGEFYRFEPLGARPRPVQKPHPPIWIGGAGPRRTLPLVARHADVWHSFGSVEVLARKAAVLDEAAREAGRDPATIVRATNLSLSEPWDEVQRTALDLADAGFSYLIASWPADGRPRVDEFVARLLPELMER
jgi:alkanesulfonate monooxygenase SsuD/methylene tetrahydromethanopterin reductase-like flavin-dependent oxidoreductase (luciferase family)